jgi:hypothetical protein
MCAWDVFETERIMISFDVFGNKINNFKYILKI